MYKMELQEILDVFKYLSTPFENQPNDNDNETQSQKAITLNKSPQDILQSITKHCLTRVDFLESSKPLLSLPSVSEEEQDVIPNTSWHLSCIILSLLNKLKGAIETAEALQTEEEKAINVLSIQAQINVQKSIELVIGFGVVPYLLPGLGVPEKLRKMSPSVPYFLADAHGASPYHQFLRLSHTIEILLNCSEQPSLNALILPKYTSDILAGLLQVCKAPIALPKIISSSNAKTDSLSSDQYKNVMKIRENMEFIMHSRFLENVPKSTYINSLFLIGATEKPRWIGNACSELLHNVILSKNGLIMVSTALLDTSGRSDSWKLMRVIANLMKAALLKSGKLKERETLCNLSEQCFHLVKQNPEVGGKEDQVTAPEKTTRADEKSEDSNRALHSLSSNLPYGTNVELLRIGFFCSLTLMEVNVAVVKLAFWERLFSALLHLDMCQDHLKNVDFGIKLEAESKSTKVSASIQKTSLCVTYGELFLSLLKPMGVTFPLKVLQPVWSLFLQIFVACERYLRKPVQEPKISGVVEQLHHKLRDVLILLFEIYASGSGQSLSLPSITGTGNTSTNQKRPTKEHIDLCGFCIMLVLNQQTYHDGSPSLNKFDFEDGEEGFRIVRLCKETISTCSNYNEVYDENLDPSCMCLSRSILKNEKLKEHWPEIFRQLLAWGTKRQSHGKRINPYEKLKSDEMPTHLSGNTAEDSAVVNLEDCQRFITFKLLGELGEEDAILEQFGKSESVSETFDFLELLLNKFTSEAFSNSDNAFDSSQLIMYALGIIGALVEAASAATATMSNQPPINQSPPSSSQIDKEINDMWDNLERFIPHLRKLTECTQPSLVRQGIPKMASNLLLSVGTRGKDGLRRETTSGKNEILKSLYQQAMEDALNPMVHIKGHGILQLRRLIEQRDRDTLENEVQVLKIFRENLINEDSYIYLMSIQGLAALALKFHKKVVPLLINEYDFPNCEGVGGGRGSDTSSSEPTPSQGKMYGRLDTDEQIEIRMKIGEILVKVIQKLGGIAPSYRVPLTNVFFRLMRDDEPLIRASALSNLGELCHLLKFSLGTILTEVWHCVQSILSTERNIHVRRASLHLIVLLLKGVEKEFTAQDIFQDNVLSEHLRDVRRFLTQTEQTEVDLVGKTHCQLALQELELIVRKLLTPRTSLEFKIEVLNI